MISAIYARKSTKQNASYDAESVILTHDTGGTQAYTVRIV